MPISLAPVRTRRCVAVVGGGIAGLMTACVLDPARFDVTVYEAQPERTTGAALGLWPAARSVLERAGVAVPPATADTRVEIHRLTGTHLLTLPSPRVAQIMRPALMSALTDAVPATVRRVRQEVLNPTQLDADLIIGADGVRSRVRELVEPRAAEREATPWVTLRGVTAEVGVTEDGVAREFWGRGRLFGDAPVGSGRYWFTAHRAELGPEPLDVRAALDDARRAFDRAAPAVRRVLDDAGDGGGGEPLVTRLWTTPPMRRYAQGRYVVVGDAAHAALPNLGRGASDAILDAVSLGTALNAGGSLRRWELRRVPVTQAARWGAAMAMRVGTWG